MMISHCNFPYIQTKEISMTTKKPSISQTIWIASLFIILAGPLNGQAPCLKDAWQAFNTHDYQGAIKGADDCIDQFEMAADREESKLENDHTPLPPTGSVPDAEKQRI